MCSMFSNPAPRHCLYKQPTILLKSGFSSLYSLPCHAANIECLLYALPCHAATIDYVNVVMWNKTVVKSKVHEGNMVLYSFQLSYLG
ncbi:hypothetical protein Y032_0041g472 [Ancylostoma ceylanicum]|uniref:Uncharacterized protein n=1 Tax=Ancylostoma ceylanicum TaxID=53326 RepID=A0A016UGL7_9BILA|nr:hypothetical protein Y032_0041g472 [Ancylostoma ceylanicum]